MRLLSKLLKLIQFNLHSIETANGMLEEGENYVKSSCRFDKIGCKTFDSEDTKKIQGCKSELNFKHLRSMDCFLKFESMKLELLVMGDQYALVNRIIIMYTPPVKL